MHVRRLAAVDRAKPEDVATSPEDDRHCSYERRWLAAEMKERRSLGALQFLRAIALRVHLEVDAHDTADQLLGAVVDRVRLQDEVELELSR